MFLQKKSFLVFVDFIGYKTTYIFCSGNSNGFFNCIPEPVCVVKVLKRIDAFLWKFVNHPNKM